MKDLGIKLELKSSKKIKLDFFGVIDVITNLTSDIHGIITGNKQIDINLVTTNINGILKSITFENTPESLLSKLIQKGYANAIKNILLEYNMYINIPSVKKETKIFQRDLKTSISNLEKDGFTIDNTFFEDFENSKLAIILSQIFSEWLDSYKIDALIKRRIENYFSYKLLENLIIEFASDSNYRIIMSYILTPFANSEKRMSSWINYRINLIGLMDSKINHDYFSYNEIYINLLGYYNKCGKSVIVRTEDWLLEWIDQINGNNILLVSGKPASGKTILLKRIAYIRAKEQKKVLYIPLYKLNLDFTIKKSIEIFCIDNIGYNLLEGFNESNDTLVILFDGLDEIAYRGEDSLKVARRLIDKIINEFSNEKNIKIIISGRSIVISDSSNMFIGSDNIQYVLNVLPMYISEDDIDDDVYTNDENLPLDLRDEWWRKYGIIRSKPYMSIPEEIINNVKCYMNSLDEISGEPFLSYLLALSYENESLDYSNEISANTLYQDFVLRIYEGTWKDKKHLISYQINSDDYISFLQEVGLCSWQEQNRVIKLNTVVKRCENAGLGYILKNICDDQNISQSITGLMLLFYFDYSSQRNDNSEAAFEFSHKSFGEYLAGVKIAKIIINNFSNINYNILELILELISVFGPQMIDEYICNFVFNELNDEYHKNANTIERIYKNLAMFFPLLLSNNIPISSILSDNDMAHNQYRKNLENAIFTLIALTGKVTKSKETINFSKNQLHSWINHKNNHLGYSNQDRLLDYSKYIGYLNIIGDYLCGAYLTNYRIENVSFKDNDLTDSSLLMTEICDCDFNNCHFNSVNLSNAIIINSTFINCHFESAIFL